MSLIIPALYKTFAKERHFTLETPDIQVSNETYTCIIGENGSGKSTFGAALSDLTHAGSDINWYYLPQYLERFLYAQNLRDQLHSLFSSHIDEDLLVSLLLELGFQEPGKMLDFPFQLLSGGERRRIALACAFYLQPENLILDEPDIGIAEKESIVILTKLNNLRAKRLSLILISHNQVYIQGSSDLICLKDGRVERQGRTRELLNDPQFDIRRYGVRF